MLLIILIKLWKWELLKWQHKRLYSPYRIRTRLFKKIKKAIIYGNNVYMFIINSCKIQILLDTLDCNNFFRSKEIIIHRYKWKILCRIKFRYFNLIPWKATNQLIITFKWFKIGLIIYKCIGLIKDKHMNIKLAHKYVVNFGEICLWNRIQWSISRILWDLKVFKSILHLKAKNNNFIKSRKVMINNLVANKAH